METPDYSKMTEREFLSQYFGANVFFGNVSEVFEIIDSKGIRNSDDADKFIKDLKAKGFTTKKKSYSDFVAIRGVKRKSQNLN